MEFLKDLPKLPVTELPQGTLILYNKKRYLVCYFHGRKDTIQLACENYGVYLPKEVVSKITPDQYEYLYHPAQIYEDQHNKVLMQIHNSINKEKL